MDRNRIIIIALVLAVVAGAFVISRRGTEDPALPHTDSGVDSGVAVIDEGIVELEVKDLDLDTPDAARQDKRSVRVSHPNPAVQRRVLDWLEEREREAISWDAQLACQADAAVKRLISVRCVTLRRAKSSDGGAPEPVYTAFTIGVDKDGSTFKELALEGVLRAGAGEHEVVEACKKMADPPLPCEWPPTAFSVVRTSDGAASLFVCHGSHCADLPEDSNILKPDLFGKKKPAPDAGGTDAVE